MTSTPEQVIAKIRVTASLIEIRHDFEKIARIINDNLWHQQEKILDAKAIAIQAGEKMREAITACSTAEAERDALRKALEPFSSYSDSYNDECRDDLPVSDDDFEVIAELGDFRRARTLLAGDNHE